MEYIGWLITYIGVAVTMTLSTFIPLTPTPEQIPTTPAVEETNVPESYESNTLKDVPIAERPESHATSAAEIQKESAARPKKSTSGSTTAVTPTKTSSARAKTPSTTTGAVVASITGIASNDVIYKGAALDLALTINDSRSEKPEQDPLSATRYDISITLESGSGTHRNTLLSESYRTLPTEQISLKDALNDLVFPTERADDVTETKLITSITEHSNVLLTPEQVAKELAAYTELYEANQLVGSNAKKMQSTTTYAVQLMKMRVPQQRVLASSVVEPILFYNTDTAFIDPTSSYYDNYGDILLGENVVYDAWGGRFLYRVDSITPERAILTKFFDKEEVGTITIPVGSTAKATIVGNNPSTVYTKHKESITYTRPATLPATLRYTSWVNKKIGRFTLTTEDVSDGANPLDSDPNGSKLVATKGWATISAAPTGNPREITISGVYNQQKSCAYNVSYVLYLPTEQRDLKWKSCDSTPYSTTLTLKQSQQGSSDVFVISIAQYRVSGQSWTYFMQDALLIEMAGDGSLKISPYDVDSGVKG